MLKNYSSSVPAAKSIANIEAALAAHGAQRIMKEYDGAKRVVTMCFTLEVREGDRMVPVNFKLPANVEQCETVLRNRRSPRTRDSAAARRIDKEQAERTAWKILFDWTTAQIAMVELAQVEILQVFLAYAYDPVREQTVYDNVKKRGVLSLTSSK